MSREVEEIKAKLDLAELIGGYIKLIPAGVNYKALCPFHHEKSPSFMVNPAKQIWRCFGCGEGGDAFSFLMKIEGLEFPEALKVLAQRTGVQLASYDQVSESRRTRLLKICDWAARYWHKILLDSNSAVAIREYINNRGLAIETLEDFKIGWAPDSWDDLINFLGKKGFTPEEIFLAGLAVRKEKGSGFYDRFRGRVMFPILDLSGRVIGFGGRTLKKDDTAKYINTPQTEIYNKSLALYGLYQAKDAIKKENLCILVEGYMDAVPSHQAGVKNVVAISGTALTLEQVKILKRYSDNIALALDTDVAGERAALRSIDIALQEEMNVKVIVVPFGKDPGECVKNNPEDWRQAISDARPIMEYYLAQALKNRNPEKPEDKKIIARDLINQIAKIGNPVERDFWLGEVAQKISVSENALREILQKAGQPKTVKSALPAKPAAIALVSDKNLVLCKRILALVFVFPNFLSEIAGNLALEHWTNPLAVDVYKKLILFYNNNINLFQKTTVDKGAADEFDLFDSLNDWFKENNSVLDPDSANLLAEAFLLSQKDFLMIDQKEAKNELDISLKILKDNYLKGRIEGLQNEMAEAEKSGDREKAHALARELDAFIAQKKN